MLQPSNHHITTALMVSSEGTQDRNRMSATKLSTTAATPTVVHPEETQDESAQDTGLWALQRDDFSEPRLLNLSIHRKALNSLACNIYFSLVNGNFYVLTNLVFVIKTPVYPSASLRAWSDKVHHCGVNAVTDSLMVGILFLSLR